MDKAEFLRSYAANMYKTGAAASRPSTTATTRKPIIASTVATTRKPPPSTIWRTTQRPTTVGSTHKVPPSTILRTTQRPTTVGSTHKVPPSTILRPTQRPTSAGQPATVVKTTPRPTKTHYTITRPTPQPPVVKTTPRPTKTHYTITRPTPQPPVVKYGVPSPSTGIISTVVSKYGVPSPTQTVSPIVVPLYGVTAPPSTIVPIVVPAYGIVGPNQLDRYYSALKGYDVSVVERKMRELIESNKQLTVKVGNDSLSLLQGNRVSSALSCLDEFEYDNDNIDANVEIRISPAIKEVGSLQELLEKRKKLKDQIATLETRYNKERQTTPAVHSGETVGEGAANVTINDLVDGKYDVSQLVAQKGNGSHSVEGKYYTLGSESSGTYESTLYSESSESVLNEDYRKIASASAQSISNIESQLYDLRKQLEKVETEAYQAIDNIHEYDNMQAGVVAPVPEYGVIAPVPEYGVIPHVPTKYGVPEPEVTISPMQTYYGVSPYCEEEEVYIQTDYGIPYMQTRYGVVCEQSTVPFMVHQTKYGAVGCPVDDQ